MDFPNITIVVTTYFPVFEGYNRREVVEKTLRSWDDWLLYHGDLHIHVADDGSVIDYHVPEWIGTWEGISYSYQHRKGVGVSLNAGFRKAFETSPLVFYGVDDWSLTQPFDLTPWAQLLMEREDCGMVRLGPPHPGTRGKIEAFTDNWQGWGLRLDSRLGFAFGHRPALYHKRMIDRFGWFKENCNALECESDYNDRVATDWNGPDIVLALPHPWQHLDSVELAYIDPKEG